LRFPAEARGIARSAAGSMRSCPAR
jgi:hypothetical protein